MNSADQNQQQIILSLAPQALAQLAGPQMPMMEPAAVAAAPPSVDLGRLWREIRKRWVLITATTAGCAILGVGYILKASKVYEARAVLRVEQEQAKVFAGQGVDALDFKSLEMLKTVEGQITSQGMLLRLVKANGLDKDPTFSPPRGTPYQEDELVGILTKRISATLRRGTRLIDIVVEDSDPQRAKRLADSLLLECTRVNREDNSASAREVRAALQKEHDKARLALEAAQRAVDDFRTAYPDMPLEENLAELKTNIFEERLRTLAGQVNETRSQILQWTNSVDQVKAAAAQGTAELLKISAIATLDEVATLSKVLSEKRNAFAITDARYKSKFPSHIRASSELAAAQQNLDRAVMNAAAGVANRLETLKDNETKLLTELEAAKRSSNEYKRIAADFDVRARELKSQRDHYSQVLSRMKEAEVIQEFGGSTLRVEDQPLTPTWPSKPRKKLVLGGATLGGLCLGLGLVFLLRMLDRTVRSLNQGEQEFGLPGLAAVPTSVETDPRLMLLTSPGVAPETAESFRSLRTSLSILGSGINARSFLFTSAEAQEGKSQCATNYAVALAQQGYRTLLIDGDMRSPSLDEVFLGARNHAGLASHLQGVELPGSKACNPTHVPNLFLFSAGIADQAHPGELLSSQAFHDLLQDAMKWFHKIVIDSPPANAVTDALLMAREVDSVVLVVRAGETSKHEARHAINKLTRGGARPVGFVLNGVSKDALASGYTGDYAHAALAPMPLALPRPAVA